MYVTQFNAVVAVLTFINVSSCAAVAYGFGVFHLAATFCAISVIPHYISAMAIIKHKTTVRANHK
jgi:hypothetical protein